MLNLQIIKTIGVLTLILSFTPRFKRSASVHP